MTQRCAFRYSVRRLTRRTIRYCDLIFRSFSLFSTKVVRKQGSSLDYGERESVCVCVCGMALHPVGVGFIRGPFAATESPLDPNREIGRGTKTPAVNTHCDANLDRHRHCGPGRRHCVQDRGRCPHLPRFRLIHR